MELIVTSAAMEQLRWLLLALLCLSASGRKAPRPPAEVGKNPNIWSIVADDLTVQVLSLYKGRLASHIATPNINRLASEGVTFKNAFTVYPLCSPSRGTLLTGQHAHKHGVRHLKSVSDHPGFTRTMPKNLKHHGYQTAIFGKWHVPMKNLNNENYDDFLIINNEHEDFYGARNVWVMSRSGTSEKKPPQIEKDFYCDSLFVDKSLEFVKARDKSRPFYVSTHFKACHEPFLSPRDLMKLLEDVKFDEPPGFFHKLGINNSVMPAMAFDDWIGKAFERQPMHPDWGVPPRKSSWTKEELWKASYQVLVQLYLQCVVGMDRHIGRVLDFIDSEQGLKENTVVMFTADHGFFLGEHSWFDKRTAHEESSRVPLLFRYPGKIPRNTICNELVSNVDFVPTLMEYAGYEPIWEIDGKSLIRLAAQQNDLTPWPQHVYLHILEMPRDPPYIAHCAMRSHRHKLIFLEGLVPPLGNTLPSRDAWELYDLQADPLELNNLYRATLWEAESNALAKEFHSLRALLAQHVLKHNDSCPLPSGPLISTNHSGTDNLNQTPLQWPLVTSLEESSLVASDFRQTL
eukprot:g72689.t1